MQFLAPRHDRDGIGSRRVDELRWLAPVRPGDQLSLRVTVTEARRSRSKPDRGLVHTVNQMINQRGEVVFSFLATAFVPRRSGISGA